MTIFEIYARRAMDKGRQARRRVRERFERLLEASEDAMNRRLLGHRYEPKTRPKKGN